MYSVSADYLTAIHENVQSGYINGTIDGVAFTPDDVLLGSASISNKCADGQDIKLGLAAIGTLKITFVNKNLVARGTWENKEIVVYWNQLIDDETQTFEAVPCGVYIIAEANHAAEGVVVTAYDRMYLLEKNLNFTTTSGSIYSILSTIASDCGVTLGQSRAYYEALPNGDETFSIYPDNDMKTYHDLLYWTAQTCGTFATFDRSGSLVLRSYGSTPVMTVGADERIAGGSFSDFKTFYTGLSVVDIAYNETKYYNLLPDNGLTMNLGSNPLLQYGLAETVKRQRLAILNSLSNFNYTPFSTSMLGNPIFDLGDVIRFEDGIAGSHSNGCVMSYTYTFNRVFNVAGYGKNPATLGAQSKTDKDVSGLASKTQSNETKFIKYTNAEGITIPADVATSYTLATIEVSTARDGWAEVQTTFTFDVRSGIAISSGVPGRLINLLLDYYLDGERVSLATDQRYFHVKQNVDYTMTFEHYFAIRIGANERKTLTVKFGNGFLRVYTGNTGNLGEDTNANSQIYVWENGLNIYVKGQGLSNEIRWDGIIILSDELQKAIIGGLSLPDIVDTQEVTIITPITPVLSDDLQEAEINGVEIVDIDESYNIVLAKPKYNFVALSGDNLVAIDGDNITTI